MSFYITIKLASLSGPVCFKPNCMQFLWIHHNVPYSYQEQYLIEEQTEIWLCHKTGHTTCAIQRGAKTMHAKKRKKEGSV